MMLFCYGTLTYPRLREAVSGVRLRARSARLRGHVRRAVRGEPFPSLRRTAGASVRGVVVGGVTASRLRFLDVFEGSDYRRVVRRVHLQEGGTRLAWCYVCAPHRLHRLADHDWDPARFAKHDLRGYLRRCRALGRGLRVRGTRALPAAIEGSG